MAVLVAIEHRLDDDLSTIGHLRLARTAQGAAWVSDRRDRRKNSASPGAFQLTDSRRAMPRMCRFAQRRAQWRLAPALAAFRAGDVENFAHCLETRADGTRRGAMDRVV
ncbi:MAG: hypothetical protein WKG00_39955 [Polyangiaceae bacterium]